VLGKLSGGDMQRGLCDADTLGIALHGERLVFDEEGRMMVLAKLPAPSRKFPRPRGMTARASGLPPAGALFRGSEPAAPPQMLLQPLDHLPK